MSPKPDCWRGLDCSGRECWCRSRKPAAAPWTRYARPYAIHGLRSATPMATRLRRPFRAEPKARRHLGASPRRIRHGRANATPQCRLRGRSWVTGDVLSGEQSQLANWYSGPSRLQLPAPHCLTALNNPLWATPQVLPRLRASLQALGAVATRVSEGLPTI